MNRDEYNRKVRDIYGADVNLARKFEVTKPAVHRWFKMGFPVDVALSIEKETEGVLKAINGVRQSKVLTIRRIYEI